MFKKAASAASQKGILKAIQPQVDQALVHYEEIRKLSNDGLREKTVGFRKRIEEYIAPKEAEIEALKEKINSDETDIEEKEKLYKELDRLDKGIV